VVSYVKDLISNGASIDLLGCVDDMKAPGRWLDTRILGRIDVLSRVAAQEREFRFITAIGDNAVRLAVVERLKALGLSEAAWTLVHPRAYVGPDSKLGAGTLVAPGALVTSGVTVGDHVILNVRASISHDCHVGDFVNVNPGATLCGNVHVAQGAFLGAGSTVIERVRIGHDALVGAGAVVIRDVPDAARVVGIPAHALEGRTKEPGRP
jgi:sugar O-acyltransferase (sialic acid O-acetyltransferase NeuD family)